MTGGGSGIGRACALGYEACGASSCRGGPLVVADYNAEKGQAAADEIAAGGKALFVKVDVSKEDEVKHMVEVSLVVLGL